MVPPDGPPEPATTVQPFTPRYQDVPDAWKWPLGPYRQAPPEFGGEWWKVNPFTGPEPWRQVEISPEPEIRDGFTEIFGTRPRASDFSSFRAHKAAELRWEQDLKFFQRSGIPEGYDQAQVELAAGVFEKWDMGRPVFYEGRYGWMARFPDSRYRISKRMLRQAWRSHISWWPNTRRGNCSTESRPRSCIPSCRLSWCRRNRSAACWTLAAAGTKLPWTSIYWKKTV